VGLAEPVGGSGCPRIVGMLLDEGGEGLLGLGPARALEQVEAGLVAVARGRRCRAAHGAGCRRRWRGRSTRRGLRCCQRRRRLSGRWLPFWRSRRRWRGLAAALGESAFQQALLMLQLLDPAG